ncbi:MAG: hypothetical protein HY925_10810, partial [Elusimicrobia bacterium]|nr:hypothetical protein [Elusimicrobiota bacterium]
MSESPRGFQKAKEFFERNKPAVILVLLFLFGGLAAITKFIGAPQRHERRSRPLNTPMFDAKVDRWKAPTM